MNMHEAEQQGYRFTGITYNRWRDKEARWEKVKQIAKEIKKTYRDADYVIVSGRKGDWLGNSDTKAIMGNKVFNMVYDEHVYHYTQDRVERYEITKQKLLEKFNKELAELEENKNKDLEFLKKIESLKK